MTQIQTYGIIGWFRRNFVRFLLGAIAGLVLDVAGIIRRAWGAVNGAIRDAAATSRDAFGLLRDVALQPIDDFNRLLFDLALGSQFGPLEAPIIVSLYAVELAIVVRLARPALLAGGELASGVPVLGGVINSAVTGFVRTTDSLFAYGRRTLGGLA